MVEDITEFLLMCINFIHSYQMENNPQIRVLTFPCLTPHGLSSPGEDIHGGKGFSSYAAASQERRGHSYPGLDTWAFPSLQNPPAKGAITASMS